MIYANALPAPSAQSSLPPARARQWLLDFNQDVVSFYTKPLIAKWLKAFKNPAVLIISPDPVDTTPWQKKLKARQLHWKPLNQALLDANGPYDLVLVFHPEATPGLLYTLDPLLRKGGCMTIISQNLWDQWDLWQVQLAKHGLLDPYAVGFHPKGVASWWPWLDGLTLPLGQAVNELACLLPGRYTTGLRFGHRWLFRCFKRDDITRFDSL